MGEVQNKRFDEPDEAVDYPKLTGQIVALGELYVGRYVHNPGWQWSKDMGPIVGTPTCQFHHQGVVVSGQMVITTDDGLERLLGPNEVFEIPPGHDGHVVGDEPFVTIEFRGARDWAKPPTSGERILATLLMTDIVGSTTMVQKLGDLRWAELLNQHLRHARVELDRFRGYEIETTGDGLLALFDGAARAVKCAALISQVARHDGIDIRAGVHTGEVERHADRLRGVAVHVAQRIMSLAEPGEVFVSKQTVSLLEGSELEFVSVGEHELKGLPDRREVFKFVHGGES
jgi:class 3 adenylate cyclase